MSGYITGTGSEDFDRAYDWGTKDRKVRQAVGVDTAIREGVGEMMQRGGSAGYQPPMSQPWGGSQYSPPTGTAAAPTAPQAAPQAPAAAAPAVTPAPAQAAPEGPGARLRMGTLKVEDPTGRATNPWGFTGFYQFGTGALKDAGVYEPAQGEDLTKNQWTGTVVLPSGKRLTHAEFAADPEAQHEAWDAHQARLGTEIDRRGLNRYIGQTRGGIPITEDTIRAMMHFGGANGAQLFLTTDGAYNPTDANGVSLSAYAQRVLGGQGGYQGGAGGAAPSVSGMGLFGQGAPAAAATDPTVATQGNFNARMDPILSRLAQTPGGGATALSILNNQSRYDMALGKRNDAYQRLAMQALGKGDIGLFQYYARVGGLNVPDGIVQNAGLRQRLSVGSLTAERLYRDDPQQAAAFVQAYMQTGDAGQAFRMAGAPRSNPHISIQQVYDAETNTVQYLGVVTRGPGVGTASPITMASPSAASAAPAAAQPPADGQAAPAPAQAPQAGAPVTGAPKPSTGRQADRIIRLQMLKAAGFDDQAANAIAAGARPTPSTIVNALTRVQKMVQDDFSMASDKKAGEVEGRMAAMFGDDWRNQMRGAVAQPGGQSQSWPQPLPQHIDALRAHPERAADFDRKFGPGAAARVLGQ